MERGLVPRILRRFHRLRELCRHPVILWIDEAPRLRINHWRLVEAVPLWLVLVWLGNLFLIESLIGVLWLTDHDAFLVRWLILHHSWIILVVLIWVPISFSPPILRLSSSPLMDRSGHNLRGHLPVKVRGVAVVHELGVVLSLLGVQVVVYFLLEIVLDPILVPVYVDDSRLLSWSRHR